MMARDNGEFELILGNKQLLSVLFIVIVLLGVFFAMGFLAGRTTAVNVPPVTAKMTNAPPLVVEPTGKESPAAPAKEIAAVETKPAAEPVKEEKKAAPAKEEKAREVEKKAPEPAKKEAPRAEPPAAPAKGGFVETPPKGQYLQVAATKRPDAEALLAQLSKNGMAGYITPVPKQTELLRVIVGPLSDGERIAETREKLKKVGIEKGYIVKY